MKYKKIIIILFCLLVFFVGCQVKTAPEDEIEQNSVIIQAISIEEYHDSTVNETSFIEEIFTKGIEITRSIKKKEKMLESKEQEVKNIEVEIEEEEEEKIFYQEPTVVEEVEEELYWEPETTEVYVESYDYSPREYEPDYFEFMGILEWGGWRWTWYSQQVLPGGGLDIPGRHVDSDGYVCDENDYICLASDYLSWGTVVNTPFGKPGRVYDCGPGAWDILDVYVDW